MFANAADELAAARKAVADESVPQTHREKRARNAEDNHRWTATTLQNHLDSCVACQARESALRPAFKD